MLELIDKNCIPYERITNQMEYDTCRRWQVEQMEVIEAIPVYWIQEWLWDRKHNDIARELVTDWRKKGKYEID